MHSEAELLMWKRLATQQGLVCLVCGKPPALQRREEFYDSGLCRACAEEIELQSRARGEAG